LKMRKKKQKKSKWTFEGWMVYICCRAAGKFKGLL